MSITRSAALAGTFYPEQPDTLRQDVFNMLLASATNMKSSLPLPKAIIAPHAGYVFSGSTAASIYARMIPARQIIRKIVLIGPSHYVGFQGIVISSADFYQTPLGTIPLDREAASQLLTAIPGVVVNDQAQAPEHCLEVHLPFLQVLFEHFTLLPMLVGNADPSLVARCLELVWGGQETLVIISSDLSHYLEYDKAREIDAFTKQAIENFNGKVLSSKHACGYIPIAGLLQIAEQHKFLVETVETCNSADTAGPRDSVVGYGAWAFCEAGGLAQEILPPLDQAIRNQLPNIARQVIAFFLSGKGMPAIAPGAPISLYLPAACFVTLKHHGQLRGCIGSPAAFRPLAEDLVDNAINAATRDSRFQPVTLQEMDALTISVSLLTPAQPMIFKDEADLLSQIRPGIDGLIIEDSDRRALFLPSVWAVIPAKEDFLGQLKLKAGLALNHWSDNFVALRFETIEIEES